MALFSKDPTPSKPAVRGESAPVAPGTTFIAPNITFEGTLSGAEPVVIEGTIRGKVNLSGELRVGSKARVEASVHAKNVIIEGTVTGDITADQKVELVASATVDGNVKAPKIIVNEGAKFRGNVDMGSPRPKDAANEPSPATSK